MSHKTVHDKNPFLYVQMILQNGENVNPNNTDYFLPCGVVIKKEDDKLVIENPGSIRTGKKQMLRGGISDPRNKTLMKMFNMIGIGERAGSGIPDIYQVWENEGWPMPVVEESYNPDRTRLSLEFLKKQANKTSELEKEPKRSQKGAQKEPKEKGRFWN